MYNIIWLHFVYTGLHSFHINKKYSRLIKGVAKLQRLVRYTDLAKTHYDRVVVFKGLSFASFGSREGLTVDITYLID